MIVELTIPELDFELPPALEAGEPPEARGLARDDVRLMVSHYGDDSVRHTRFRELPRFLAPGDLLVVNTSGTLSAALPAERADGRRAALHLSTRLPAGLWSVELRRIAGASTAPSDDAARGEVLRLPGGATATLLAPLRRDEGLARLWVAELSLPMAVEPYLEDYGAPIRYGYVERAWRGARSRRSW
jgi:S-adenosylmethionine:tRNA ribosyltransferase-isomerase